METLHEATDTPAAPATSESGSLPAELVEIVKVWVGRCVSPECSRHLATVRKRKEVRSDYPSDPAKAIDDCQRVLVRRLLDVVDHYLSQSVRIATAEQMRERMLGTLRDAGAFDGATCDP